MVQLSSTSSFIETSCCFIELLIIRETPLSFPAINATYLQTDRLPGEPSAVRKGKKLAVFASGFSKGVDRALLDLECCLQVA